MRNGQINSLSEIDMEHLSFEDIRWRYGVFHPTSTGAGRDKQYSAWIGVQTSLGEIEKGVWYQAAEALIQKAGEQKLLEALNDWESRTTTPRIPPELCGTRPYSSISAASLITPAGSTSSRLTGNTGRRCWNTPISSL